MFRRQFTLLAALIISLGLGSTTNAQPPADFTWTNFVSVGTFWTTGTNWTPLGPPTSSTDRVLWFGSSPLQTANGYTTTFSNAGAAFDLNSLVFNSFGASNTSLVVTGNAAGDTLRFNTSSTLLQPSIWQVGTGRAIIQNGTATNGITLTNGTTLNILGNGIGELQLNANIVQTGVGSSGILINQTGTASFATGSIVRLGGANTFQGGVTLTSGNLVLASAGALGTAGTFTVNGGSVQLDPLNTTGLTIANPVTLNSNMLITGNVNQIATIPTAPLLTFSGAVGGVGGITIANNNSNLSGGGFATMTYALTGANSFQGPINISPIGNSGTLLTVGTGTVATGTVAGTTSINVSWAGTFRLDNTAGVATRLNTTTAPALNLNSSTFQLFGNSAASASETFGTLTLAGNGGVTVLGTSATLQTTTATFAGLSRPTNGTLFLVGTNLGSNSGAGESIIRFATDPGGSIGGGGLPGTQNINVLPYAVANAGASTTTLTAAAVSGMVRWDSGSQKIVPLTAPEYATNLYLAGSSTNNFRNQSTTALPSALGAAGINNATTINSLVLDTNTAVTNRVGVSVQGTGTLTVGSGAIFSTVNNNVTGAPSNPSMINLGGLDFGANPGYVHTFANLTVNAPITGSAGLVKGAGGTLTLTGNNTFTGGLTVNSGLVQFFSDSNLGAAGQPINLQGGSGGGVQFLAPALWTNATSGALTVNRPINLVGSGGNITITALNNSLTLSGSLSGSGQLFRSGSGALILTGNNSGYTGTMLAFNGLIAAQNDAALGGPGASVMLTSAQLQPLTSFATSKDIILTFNGTIYTGGQNLTLNGNLTTQNSAATFFKTGLGDLIINSTSTVMSQFQNGFSSPLSVVFSTTGNGVQTSGRTVFAGANGAMPLAAGMLSIANGEIVFDNTAAVNNNRMGNVTLSLIGGNASLLGNALAPVNEAIGAISFNNANNPFGGVLTLSTPVGSGQSTTLNALSISANATGGTMLVRGNGLGFAVGDRTALILGTTPVAVNGLVPSLVTANSATSEATDFAALQTIVVPAPNTNQFSVVPFAAYTAGGALGAGSATATYDVNVATTFGPGASASNAMKISGQTVDLGAGTHTSTAGAILSTGGAAGSISNGTLAFGANPARFTVTAGSNLTVSASTTGSAGLIKTGNGTLTLNTPTAITVVATTSFFGIGAGTLQYGVANALPITPNVFINGGATLDINGTTSTVGNINGYGNVNIGSGSLTVGSIAQITSFGGALSGNGTFVKNTAAITTTMAGDSTAGFTGGVQILGGTLTLLTPGAIGTGATPILLGDTGGSVRSLLTLGPLLTSFTRDVTVQAGSTPGATPHTITAPAGTSTIASNIIINNTASTVTSGGFTATGVGLQLSGTSGAGGGNANQTGIISGAGGIYLLSGNWSFTGNNTYSGGTFLDTTINAAMGIGIDSTPNNSAPTSGPFGTGALSFSTGFGMNLRADGGARTISNQINISSTGGYFGVGGTNALTLNGPVNLQGAAVAQTFNIMNTAKTTINGVISNGTAGINKNGPGILEISGNNIYTGTTTVNAGTLCVTNTVGSGTGTGQVNVNSGAILGGTGNIAGLININPGGILAPGCSPGILSTGGGITFAGGGIFDVELQGLTAGTQYDQVLVTAGAVTLGAGVATLNLLPSGYTPASTDVFVVISNTGAGALTGTFAGLPDQSIAASNVLGSGIDYLIYYGTYSGFPTSVVIAPVPEPATVLALCAAGAGAVGLIRRRRKASQIAA